MPAKHMQELLKSKTVTAGATEKRRGYANISNLAETIGVLFGRGGILSFDASSINDLSSKIQELCLQLIKV